MWDAVQPLSWSRRHVEDAFKDAAQLINTAGSAVSKAVSIPVERRRHSSIARNGQARGGWERQPESSSSLHDQLCQLLISDSTATYMCTRAGWGVSVRA